MAKSYNWTFAADGNGASQPFDFSFSNAQFIAFGSTFGSGTVKLQFSPNWQLTTTVAAADSAATWIDIPTMSLTANGALGFRESFGNRIRPVLTGSTSPSITIRVMDTIY